MARGVVAVVCWVAGALSLGGLLTLLHDGPLPPPRAELRDASGVWSMTHGASMRCPCSKRIVDHLLQRGATAGAQERIMLAESSPELVAQLQARGFVVDVVAPEGLVGQGFEAVPGLVIRRPDGTVAYAGAHAPRRTGPIDDVALLASVRAGETRAPFAVLGCAVSRSLSERVDPLGLKSFFSGTP